MSGPPPLSPQPGFARPDYAGPPAPAASNVFDARTFTRHLTGWVLLAGLLLTACLFILPRYEEQLKDFRVELPALTVLTLSCARLLRRFWFLAVPVAVAHAALVGLWFPHAGLGARRFYRLLLTLCLGALFAVVILSLFLPIAALYDALSGAKK
jgi:type II secretory pathway component PulF